MAHAESVPHPGIQMRRDSTLKPKPHLLSTAPKMSTALAPKLRMAEVQVTNKVGILNSALAWNGRAPYLAIRRGRL